MNLLVTGGAGFIGANFVRYWLDQHPGDDVVVLDLLTYAGVRENVPDGVPLVEGDIADGELAERTLQEHADRRRRQLRGGVPQQLRGRRPGPLLPNERARHADAARGGAPHRA